MFDECPEVVPVLVVQSLIGLLMDAILLNMVYTRFSTAFTRSASVIFTDVALVYEEKGLIKIGFRVCEVARKPLIEPLVRVYCVVHREDELDELEVEVHQVPLEEPDLDVADGKMFLTLPSRVVLALDERNCLGHTKTLEQFHAKLSKIPFLELIVVLSGTCPITGNMLEARQSYTASDLRSNCRFASCVRVRDNMHQVDFELFHQTVRIDFKT